MLAPKTHAENLRFRAKIFEACERDPQTASVVRELSARDVLFFFNTFLWAEDPFAEKGLRSGVPKKRIRPIITYPFQEDFILSVVDAINTGESLVADKSRDMLATYIVLGVFLHGWLFRGHKYLISSWKEVEIDGKDDTSTHFGKLRFFLRRLPRFMQPRGFDLHRKMPYMSLQNPENGGTLTGTAASASLGSGRREDAILFDELSKWERYASEAWTSASDATKCKIGVWTPRGSGNKAAELMRGTEVKRKHHLLWYLHPEKTYTSDAHKESVAGGRVYDKVGNYTVQFHPEQKCPGGCYVDQYGKIRSEWYDDECSSREREDIAENIDCNYLTSGRNVFDTLKCDKKLYEARDPEFIGTLAWKVKPVFDESGACVNTDQLEAEFVPNVNGLLKIWEKPIGGWENGYCLSADVAEGLEQGDFDSASVLKRFDEDKPRIVATLHGHLKPHEYAEELVKLAVYYGYAWLAPERNNQGLAVINQMFGIYRKIYFKEVLVKGYPEITDKLGFETNRLSKPTIIEKLNKLIAVDGFRDDDAGFWRETLTFVNDDGKLEAQGKSRGEKCFDDRVMDRAILLWVHDQLPPPYKIEPKRELAGWRKARQNRQSENSLVGWVV